MKSLSKQPHKVCTLLETTLLVLELLLTSSSPSSATFSPPSPFCSCLKWCCALSNKPYKDSRQKLTKQPHQSLCTFIHSCITIPAEQTQLTVVTQWLLAKGNIREDGSWWKTHLLSALRMPSVNTVQFFTTANLEVNLPDFRKKQTNKQILLY